MRRPGKVTFRLVAPLLLVAAFASAADEPAATFFRGINLNGPAVEIDGQAWEGRDSSRYQTSDSAFEDQAVPLVPETDDARTLMIRSSRWSGQVNIRFTDIPPGRHQAGIYIWEDNNSERFSLALQGQEVEAQVDSGAAGQWRRLGPYRVEVGADRQLILSTNGGAANISGVEIWSGWGPAPEVGETSVVMLPEVTPEQSRLFREDVAPLLARHCLECHAGAAPEGGLNLAEWRAAASGGESGPAIVPGDPARSLIWQAVDRDEMPQNRPPLTADEKSTLEQWIAAGALWAERTIDPYLASTDRRAGYDWWSLQPVLRPPLPSFPGSDGLQPIDTFLQARLREVGLSPAAEADRRTLIRRVAFDLTGLPPTPEEVSAFVESTDPDAYPRLVDRLLDSPHYGERWARHWLDVIRFGESQGYERNRIRDNAWRFRDWVIEALNRNLPYDEFVRQQIAGDVLYPDDLSALIATGYHVVGTWDQVGDLEGSAEMKKANRQDHLEDLTACYSQTFLGLTVNCARCHDHKFDPISQQDYYRITALLSGVRQKEPERSEITLQPRADRLAERDFAGTAHVSHSEPPPATFLLARGNYREPREAVAPAGLKAIEHAGLPGDLGLPASTGDAERRRALAEWTTNPRHPLTARVFVNRVWRHHFGQGIVDTPSDFGFAGGEPSHPQLLDWLAAEFVESGWDIKALHRRIVTSHAYRQQSRVESEQAEQLDGDNRLLWRANQQRLEGEQVRDAVLFVAGALNPQLGGPSFRDVNVALKQNHEFTTPTNEFNDDTSRRAIYRLWARSGNHPLLEGFDCPDPTVAAPQRTRTITPMQALSLLNNRFVEAAAQRFADRVRQSAGDDAAAQATTAWLLAFQRSPTASELASVVPFIREHGTEQLCLTVLNTNEFLYVD
ncbi:MAG: PSD1 domain-containing protein [Planctomyces sp.]|nr:PSD1 domain-containing protein [Planctomyces sp.]